MKNTIRVILVLLSLTIVLVSCSSPKDANKKNFTKAINAYLSKNDITLTFRIKAFPLTIELPKPTKAWMAEDNTMKIKPYEALVNIGFLQVKDDSIEKNKYWGFSNNNEKITIPVKTYSLTEKGKQFFVKGKGTGFSGSNVGFSAAKQKVKEIINFSEPSPIGGYTASMVNYTISIHSVNEWTKNPIILENFPRLVEDLKSQKTESAALILMNDGWIHEKESNL